MAQGTLQSLIARLDTASDHAAEKAIAELTALKSKAVPSLLKAAKQTEKPRVRKWALQALGALGSKRAAPLLVDALKDPRMTVRLHAVKGLSRMKHKAAAPEIAKLLNDPSGGVRVNSLQALTHIGDDSQASAIMKSLTDPKWYVRQNACIACGALGFAKAKSRLKKMSKDDERKAVRDAAVEALSLLGQQAVSPKCLLANLSRPKEPLKMAKLKMLLIEKLEKIPGLEDRPSRVAGGSALFYKGKEIAHFHGNNELDVRLTKKVIREEGLEHPQDSRVHPGRAKGSEWIELRFKSEKAVDEVVRLVAKALKQY